MRRQLSFIGVLALIGAAVIAGCGGGGGGSSALPAGGPTVSASGVPGAFKGPMSSVQISLKMPVYGTPSPLQKFQRRLQVQRRHPSGQITPTPSPSPTPAPSIVFTVNGTIAATVSLSQGQQGLYFVTVPMPVGSDAVVADLYDGANGTGNKIATGSTSATISASGTNTVNLTLAGIIAQICPTLATAAILTGTSGSIPVQLRTFDADGNYFLHQPSATLSTAVTLTATGVSGATFSPASITDVTTPVVLTWTAAASGSATLNSSFACAPNPQNIYGLPATVSFGGPYGYVASVDGSVWIFDQSNNSGRGPVSNAVSGFFDSQHPQSVVFDSKTSPKRLFVADSVTDNPPYSHSIHVYNAETNTSITTFDLSTGQRAWGLSLSSDGSKLFVSSSGNNDEVDVFDATATSSVPPSSTVMPSSAMQNGSFLNGLTTFVNPSNAQDETIVAARYPSQNPSSSSPSLASITGDAPTAYSASTIPKSPLTAAAFASAYSPQGVFASPGPTVGSLLVRENGSAGIEWIDLNAGGLGSLANSPGIAEQSVPGPNALAIDGTGSHAYAVGGNNQLYALDWSGSGWEFTSCAALDSGTCGTGSPYMPVGVALSNDGYTLYVLNSGLDSVSAVDVSCGSPNPSSNFQFGVGHTPIAIAIGNGGNPPAGPPGC